MFRLLFNGKYIIIGTILTILNLMALAYWHDSLWSLAVFSCYLLFFGFYLGEFLLTKEKRSWKIFFGSWAITGLFIIPLTIIYWFYKFDIKIVQALLILVPILIGLQKQTAVDIFDKIEAVIDPSSYAHVRSYLSTKLFFVIFLFAESLLFWALLSRQHTDTLISPWTLFSYKIFILFIFTTGLLLWITQKSKASASNLFLLSLHSLLILTVALIIFKLGYGFDPHIHHATEKWILDHGLITPKQPYYLGQYLWVLFSQVITHLPISYLDKILVPLGAGISLPLVYYFALSRTSYLDKIYPALALVGLFPLSFFIFTTPNNLALLLSLIIFAWIWYENKNGDLKTHFLGLLLSLTTCTIHPFIGLPVLTIYLGFLLWKKNKLQKLFFILYSLLLVTILPLTFYFNSLRSAEKLTLKNPLENLTNFFNIFSRPHWLFLDKGDVWWKLLYYYRDLIKPLIILAIIAGLILLWKKYQEKITVFYAVTALSLIISALLISTTITFPNVISYEQNIYSTRLLELALILLLPFFVLILREFFIKLRHQPGKQFIIAIIFSGLLAVSWYFTYPTRDPISLHTGYNVRQADYTAVHFIDMRNQGIKDYIVLSNQIVGVSALDVFSFVKYFPTPAGEQYFYSIPTGAPLYQYFRKMVYEEPKRQWMEEAMRFVGVKKAYFVHTNYWAPAGELRDKAKLEADAWWELANGRVWVYEYLLD